MIKTLKNGFGYLTFATAMDVSSQYSFCELIANACFDFDENKLNNLLCLFEDCPHKIGYISNLFIHPNDRGKGHGSELMDQFMSRQSNQTDFDFLFANSDHREGQALLHFYEKFGFEVVTESNGISLMINKGMAPEFKDELEVGCTYNHM